MLDPSGSSANSTHNLCNYLAEAGCDVQVHTAPHWLRVIEGGARVEYDLQITFYRGTQLRSYEASNFAARSLWRAVRILQHVKAMSTICFRARNFDLVHTQILPLPVLDWLFIRMLSRSIPLVCTVHELVPHSAKMRGLARIALKSIYRRASTLFVFADFTRDRLIDQYGISAEKVVKVRHGNSEHMLEVSKAANGKPASDPVILFLGGIRKDKGLDVLIEAAGYLRDWTPRFKVRVVGVPGFNLLDLQKRISELDLSEMIDFQLGFIPENAFATILKNATVVALPYRQIEQSGIAIAACTFGKAIVATRCGGLEELITEAENGLLVPVDNPLALAQALATVLNNHTQRALWEKRSKAYAEGVLSWKPIAEKTIVGYQAAILRFATHNRRSEPVYQ